MDTYLYDDTIMGMSYDLTYERVSVFYAPICFQEKTIRLLPYEKT